MRTRFIYNEFPIIESTTEQLRANGRDIGDDGTQ